MRPINLTNIEERAEGEANRIKPGAYACTITAVEDFPEKEYLRVLVDVAAGEYRGYFSDGFYDDKPFAHSLVFSYKESALPMLKGRLHVITDSNPGFDAEAAIFAGKEQMLVGRQVGVVLREEEYYDKKEDEFKLGSPRPARLCRSEDFLEEKNANPKPRMLTDDQKRDALKRAGLDPDAWLAGQRLKERGVAPADVADDDVPF